MSQLLPLRDRGRKHVKSRQQALAGLIWLAYHGSYRHRKNQLGSSFSMAFLESAQCLRNSNATARTAWLKPFFDFDQGKRKGCSQLARLTKAYVLNAETRAAAKAAKEAAKSAESRTADQPAGCAIIIKDVTVEMAKRAYAEMTAMGLTNAAGYLQAALEDIPADGGLSNEYDGTFSNGRPRPASRSHLVGMPRVARSALLEDTGWYDYDISSCHVTVFLALGEKFGVSLPLLTRYATDKKRQHGEWAEAIGHHTTDDFKTLVLSFLSGGSLDVKIGTTLWNTLCYGLTSDNRIIRDRARHWVSLPSVIGLHAEIQRGIRVIVKAFAQTGWHESEESLMLSWNAVDHVIEAQSPGQVISHLLTGYEQFAMQYIYSRLPQSSVIATVYDGWISRVKLSKSLLRSLEEGLMLHSADALNLPLRLTLKAEQFTTPNPAEDF